MTSNVRAAARKTATATKVYIHADCSCARVNGSVLKGIDTVTAAEAYAAEHGFATTFCKTSAQPAPAETAPVVEETPAPVMEEAPAAEEPAPAEEAPAPVLEEPAAEEAAPVEEEPAPAKPAKKAAEEPAPVVDGPSFEVEVNNRDQYGKQRRTAVEVIAEALGAVTTYTSVKNKHKTGNDAFIVTVTGGKTGTETIIRDFVTATDNQLAEVAAAAKATAKAVEGATANDVQKAWKAAARTYITEQGQALAERVATI